MSVILGHPDFLSCQFVVGNGDRDIFGEIASADDHRTGMDSGLADASFEFTCIFEHFLGLLASVFKFIVQFAVFQAVRQFRLELLRHLLAVFHDRSLKRLVWNKFREPVRLVYRHPAHTGNILDG